MVDILIDAINETANDMIGGLIIVTNNQVPEIVEEHLINVKIMMTKYAEISSQ